MASRSDAALPSPRNPQLDELRHRVAAGGRVGRREMRELFRANSDSATVGALMASQFPHACDRCQARFRTAAAARGHADRCPNRLETAPPVAATSAPGAAVITRATTMAAVAFSDIAAVSPGTAMEIAELLDEIARHMRATVEQRIVSLD